MERARRRASGSERRPLSGSETRPAQPLGPTVFFSLSVGPAHLSGRESVKVEPTVPRAAGMRLIGDTKLALVEV